jgi:hypothetical protein
MIFDEIWRTRMKRDRLRRSFRKEIRKLDEAGDEIAAMAKRQETDAAIGYLEDELHFRRNLKLERRAERLGVPLPSLEDGVSWEAGIMDKHPSFLTVQAEANIRKGIREHWSFWVKDIISPIATIMFSAFSLTISIISLQLSLHNRAIQQQQQQLPQTTPTPIPTQVPTPLPKPKR